MTASSDNDDDTVCLAATCDLNCTFCEVPLQQLYCYSVTLISTFLLTYLLTYLRAIRERIRGGLRRCAIQIDVYLLTLKHGTCRLRR